MAINFPASPTDGQTYTENGVKWKYNSAYTAWLVVDTPILANTSSGQVLYNYNDTIVSSNGISFSTEANTLYVNNINVTSNIIIGIINVQDAISSSFNKANTACTNADTAQTIGIAAFDKANTGSSNALSNTSGISFDGTLNFPTGNVIVGNTTTNTSISPSSIVSSGSIKLSTPFFESAINVASDYTISSGYNAMSPGPISINSGVTVTVPSGSVWTVV